MCLCAGWYCSILELASLLGLALLFPLAPLTSLVRRFSTPTSFAFPRLSSPCLASTTLHPAPHSCSLLPPSVLLPFLKASFSNYSLQRTSLSRGRGEPSPASRNLSSLSVGLTCPAKTASVRPGPPSMNLSMSAEVMLFSAMMARRRRTRGQPATQAIGSHLREEGLMVVAGVEAEAVIEAASAGA